jgi:hypothetical protein
MLRRAPLLLLALLAGCASKDRCREASPAFELDLSVAPSIGARIARLRVEVGVQSTRVASAVFDGPTSRFADGRSSLEVVLGEQERTGFTAGIVARAFSGTGELVAQGGGNFAGSGDACNRFELALAGVDAQVAPTPDQGIAPVKDQGVTPAAGLGSRCSQAKPCPGAAMICAVTKSGATEGFCTKECPVAEAGKPCSGGPANTVFYCFLGDKVPPTKVFCGFLCQTKDQSSGKIVTYPCPTELECGAADANGTAVCAP